MLTCIAATITTTMSATMTVLCFRICQAAAWETDLRRRADKNTIIVAMNVATPVACDAPYFAYRPKIGGATIRPKFTHNDSMPNVAPICPGAARTKSAGMAGESKATPTEYRPLNKKKEATGVFVGALPTPIRPTAAKLPPKARVLVRPMRFRQGSKPKTCTNETSKETDVIIVPICSGGKPYLLDNIIG